MFCAYASTTVKGKLSRSDAEHQDRRVGGIDLADERWIRQVLRQIGGRGVDRRQCVADRSVDGAVQIELQVIWMYPRALADVIWVRPGISPNCSSSGDATVEAMVCGSAPGSCGRDRPRRIVDVRQRRHRQQRIGDQTADQ